jgi:peptidyl-prolyl cis-trans isomerase SurA
VFFVIDKLEEGQISTPVLMQDQSGGEAYQLLYLKRRTQPHRANIEEDYDQIQNWALMQKKAEIIRKWIVNNSRKAYIRIDDKFLECTFEHKWL